jgi:hypothetical protein
MSKMMAGRIAINRQRKHNEIGKKKVPPNLVGFQDFPEIGIAYCTGMACGISTAILNPTEVTGSTP